MIRSVSIRVSLRSRRSSFQVYTSVAACSAWMARRRAAGVFGNRSEKIRSSQAW
jgi:hypothetical protein